MSETVLEKASIILGKKKVDKKDLQDFIENNKVQGISHLDIVHFNRFNPESGVKISVEKIFGLSSKWENKYYQVLVEIVETNPPYKSLARLLSQNLKMKSCIR